MPSRHRKTQRNFKCTLLSKEANLKRLRTAWFQLYNKSKTVQTEKRSIMGCGTTQVEGRRDEWMEHRECARETLSPYSAQHCNDGPWHCACQNTYNVHPSLNTNVPSQSWWLMPINPVFAKLRQEH